MRIGGAMNDGRVGGRRRDGGGLDQGRARAQMTGQGAQGANGRKTQTNERTTNSKQQKAGAGAKESIPIRHGGPKASTARSAAVASVKNCLHFKLLARREPIGKGLAALIAPSWLQNGSCQKRARGGEGQGAGGALMRAQGHQ